MQKTKRYPYFAYGSNMVQKRLEKRVGEVIKVRTACLTDYEMQLNCGNEITGSFANIVSKKESKTYGVIYELTSHQFKLLDRFEGFYDKDVVDIDGTDIFTYYASLYFYYYPDCFVAPSFEYLRLLLQGFKENKLQEGYDLLKEKIYNNFGLIVDV